jgi:hypothetical protein
LPYLGWWFFWQLRDASTMMIIITTVGIMELTTGNTRTGITAIIIITMATTTILITTGITGIGN